MGKVKALLIVVALAFGITGSVQSGLIVKRMLSDNSNQMAQMAQVQQTVASLKAELDKLGNEEVDAILNKYFK